MRQQNAELQINHQLDLKIISSSHTHFFSIFLVVLVSEGSSVNVVSASSCMVWQLCGITSTTPVLVRTNLFTPLHQPSLFTKRDNGYYLDRIKQERT